MAPSPLAWLGSSDCCVEKLVDSVGHVQIVQGSGVGVVAQGGDGVSVPESSLRLEDFAFADQLGADAVAEAVQGSVGEAGGEAEA